MTCTMHIINIKLYAAVETSLGRARVLLNTASLNLIPLRLEELKTFLKVIQIESLIKRVVTESNYDIA